MINNVQRPALSRRKLLTGAAAGGTAVATSMTLPSTAAYAVDDPATALRAGDAEHAAALFAPDASLTGLVSHVQVAGPRSIASFLGNAGSQLPFVGPGTAVRHVVGALPAVATNGPPPDRCLAA
ncbi:twin-arginine translocation signal domain-containing protein [Kitasatospora sp. NPDC059648]|uniref:twin-arginine translocation signal domain-containing protein n=1 Tax=Kitasatospora sp. NPDC059648 TaxID=3346894 RepID=UPI0036C59FEE